ncbi:hypothetical protein ACFQY5_02040 [Paeniroseomonas aquatica]|uniref:hypothetical protein n=1 Tax=Paeniroseomonas aquatica TaxID=373043 RepID=UPI00360806BB
MSGARRASPAARILRHWPRRYPALGPGRMPRRPNQELRQRMAGWQDNPDEPIQTMYPGNQAPVSRACRASTSPGSRPRCRRWSTRRSAARWC